MSVHEGVSTFKGCPWVCPPFLVQTHPAEIPSNACSDSTFDDMEVCYLLPQNVKIAWRRLQSGSTGKSSRWKMKYWVFCTSLNAFHNTWMMEKWNPALLKKEHGARWCQQGKHLGPTELQLMGVQCFSEDKHESCRLYGDGGIKNRVSSPIYFMGTELGRLVELHEVVDLHLFKIISWDYKEGIYLTWVSIKNK